MACLLLVLLSNAAHAQAPAGPEFVVNTYTTNFQYQVSLSMDARGRFVAVWQSTAQDGSQNGIFGQRFDSSGGRMGAEFLVNAETLGNQGGADVALNRNGSFVVVWSGPEVMARRFDRSGAPVGGDFQVNSYTTGGQYVPAVAVDAAGNFMVVWQSSGGQDGSGSGIFGRRYDPNGAPLGPEFQVNVYTTGDQQRPDVISTADGGFVVVFDRFGQDRIQARRYLPSGNPIGGDIPISTAPFSQFGASVAARQPEGFVVAWTSFGQDGSGNGIFARIFDGTGAGLTAELPVNTYTTDIQWYPTVASDGTGGFVVNWYSLNQDGSGGGIFAQRFEASGARQGAEFGMNATTFGAQADQAIAGDAVGNFVGAWTSTQDGSGLSVVGRRFQGIVPMALAVDAAGNGVLDVSEVVEVAPSWQNTTDAAQDLQGVMSGFTGPLPATYVLNDPFAVYGATPAGAVRTCTDCYSLNVSAQPRPVVHWDATVIESLLGTAAAQGLRKAWTLHVGESFLDVPRANPFYRFIETLLHHGVTGGCTATEYCPASSTTREQMAVFVLVAKEGAGYLAPSCGATPMFADVDLFSGFCRWIEELARRGVVSGCGGGNYCPLSPVSREQMAVFVLRTLDPSLNPPACTPPNLFLDVPETSPFCPWVEELATRGVVTGCGGGNYCPTSPVTREQMGVFISVTFGLTLYGP